MTDTTPTAAVPELDEIDTDSDPANMNPRSGVSASGAESLAGGSDPDADTDGDPHNMNPRNQ